MERALNIAVYGGSFNPPHVAHVLACALALAVEEIDRVLVVPTYLHPFAKELAPYDDRVAMCGLALAHLRDVEVSRVEEALGGESRTLRTLEHLAAAHPDWRLRLLIGGDIVAEAPRWYGFDAIVRLAPPIVLGRAGAPSPDGAPALLPDVSSTTVREAVARGRWGDVERCVPRAVLRHIRERGLYAAAT